MIYQSAYSYQTLSTFQCFNIKRTVTNLHAFCSVLVRKLKIKCNKIMNGYAIQQATIAEGTHK